MAENQNADIVEQPRMNEPIKNEVLPQPFCNCWTWHDEKEPGNPDCNCGEEIDMIHWRWEVPLRRDNWVVLHDDDKQVIFHPFYSSGTAAVRGNAPMELNRHYYFEVKMLTEPYGSDIMVGIGSDKLNLTDALYDFRSLLGGTEESYGISYTGAICQSSMVTHDSPGFVKGTIIGVKVDMFLGTLEFYLNREPYGIVVTDLRKHQVLYPMLSSTTAQSSLRLTYASSWDESLMVKAARALAASTYGEYDGEGYADAVGEAYAENYGEDYGEGEAEGEGEEEVDELSFLRDVPPGLEKILRTQFWMVLPSAGRQKPAMDPEKSELLPAAIRRKHWHRRW
ncbi:unnamed protein product [Chrysodeixis includens]|uniref:B30.2/SPRY domain-containing protein n=1 Tax=Chrysodeixis includens TaxID=689277 RepID=A0A9P0FRB5_CHRIL|nr:unnamed protein product [Chrysodeixis includens]